MLIAPRYTGGIEQFYDLYEWLTDTLETDDEEVLDNQACSPGGLGAPARSNRPAPPLATRSGAARLLPPGLDVRRPANRLAHPF